MFVVGDVNVCNECLVSMQKRLQRLRQGAVEAAYNRVQWQRANHCMLYTDSMWAFVGEFRLWFQILNWSNAGSAIIFLREIFF